MWQGYPLLVWPRTLTERDSLHNELTMGCSYMRSKINLRHVHWSTLTDKYKYKSVSWRLGLSSQSLEPGLAKFHLSTMLTVNNVNMCFFL